MATVTVERNDGKTMVFPDATYKIDRNTCDLVVLRDGKAVVRLSTAYLFDYGIEED